MPEAARSGREPARGASRNAGVLAAGSAATGLLAYTFFAVVTRGLGAEATAPVSVLWAWWGFAGAAITFPIQHWIARTVAAHGAEAAVRSAAGRVAASVAAVSIALALASWLAREPLFGSDGVIFPLLAALVGLGSGLMGLTRGVLTARGRLGAVAVGLVAENAVRVVAAVVLVTCEVRTPAAYAGCLVFGYAAALGFPSALRVSGSGESATGRGSLSLLGGAAGAQLIGQAVLTGGPVLLALGGGSPRQVTALFAGLALFRAPYMLALGALAALTTLVTRLVVEGRLEALGRLRRSVLLLTAGGTALAAAIGLWVGPPTLRLLFGPTVRLDGGDCVLLAIGSVFAMASLVVTTVVLAHGRGGALLRAWSGAVVLGAVIFALAPAEPLTRTCLTFLVAETAALVLLAIEERRGIAR